MKINLSKISEPKGVFTLYINHVPYCRMKFFSEFEDEFIVNKNKILPKKVLCHCHDKYEEMVILKDILVETFSKFPNLSTINVKLKKGYCSGKVIGEQDMDRYYTLEESGIIALTDEEWTDGVDPEDNDENVDDDEDTYDDEMPF